MPDGKDKGKLYPLDLLEPNLDRKKSVLSKVYNPLAMAVGGFLCGVVMNWGLRKPPLSGIGKHIIGTIAGGSLGIYLDGTKATYLAERDAVLRHYVELHPEDFPPIERKKFADVLETWVPIR